MNFPFLVETLQRMPPGHAVKFYQHDLPRMHVIEQHCWPGWSILDRALEQIMGSAYSYRVELVPQDLTFLVTRLTKEQEEFVTQNDMRAWVSPDKREFYEQVWPQGYWRIKHEFIRKD